MVKVKPRMAICMVVATGGILSTVNFDINNSERVIAVLGYFDTSGVRGLVFFTSLGRVYGPYGGCAGEFPCMELPDSWNSWSIYVVAKLLSPSVSLLHSCSPIDKGSYLTHV